MARTLSNTGVAANLLWVLGVDDDNSTIKLWTEPGAQTARASGSGLTLANTAIQTGKTWKSTSVPMITFASNTSITIDTPINVSSSCCFFYVAKDWAANNVTTMMQGAGSGTTPWIYTTSSGCPVLRDSSSGSALCYPFSAPGTDGTAINLSAGGLDYSVYFNEVASANNTCFFEFEADTLADTYTKTDLGVNFSAVAPTKFGSAASGMTTEIVVFGMLSAVISESAAAAIHADPFGTLFTSGASAVAAIGRHYSRMRA